MNKVFRAHPLMIFNFLKPFLFVLLIPVVRGLIQYAASGEYDSILKFEIVLSVALFVIGFLRWWCFKLILNEEKHTITVISGLFFRRTAKINVDRLSSVQTKQNPLEFIFRAVTFRINTEAGNIGKADYEFKLSMKSAKAVSTLLYGKGDNKKIRFSLFKIAVLAATTSSAFTGILVGVPLIYRAGNLLEIAISDMLINEINNVSNKIETYFPPVVNAISLVFLGSYLISFLYSLFKYLNFRLRLGQDKMEIRSGFFVRTRTAFKKAAINNVRIEQSFLMLLLRRFAMRVSVGGYGESKSRSEVVIPLEKGQEIRKHFAEYLPFFKCDTGVFIKPRPTAVNRSRFLFFPTIYFISAVVLTIILGNRFDDFDRFALFCLWVVGTLIIIHAWFCLFECFKGKVDFGENVFIRSRKGFKTCELYCPKENVGEVKLVRFPADMWHHTCRLRITVRSERADSLCVRHLDYETVKKTVNEYFEINA
ncbi:MAG: PH domain-containing protein [Clostridia bacterium]|nr:PH domain-containing protein [Clostridia bacterium]